MKSLKKDFNMRVINLSQLRISIIFTLSFTFLVGCTTNRTNGQQIRAELAFILPGEIRNNKAPVQIEITNGSNSEILVPELLYWGIPSDPIADIIFEVQKKDSSDRFTPTEIPDNYHPSLEPVSLTKLPVTGIRKDSSDIAFYYLYNIPKGDYRVRVMYKISNYNKSKQDIFSNWLKFSIE